MEVSGYKEGESDAPLHSLKMAFFYAPNYLLKLQLGLENSLINVRKEWEK